MLGPSSFKYSESWQLNARIQEKLNKSKVEVLAHSDYNCVAAADVESTWFSVAAIMLEKADFGLASKTEGLSYSITWKPN